MSRHARACRDYPVALARRDPTRASAKDVDGRNKFGHDVSPALRTAAIVLRTLFIVLVLVLALRVSLPQNETLIWCD